MPGTTRPGQRLSGVSGEAGAGGGGGFADELRAALFARRTLLVTGELDGDQASELAAALMTLQALGDERVELRLSAVSGSLEAALMLVDVMDAVGVPVHVAGIGLLGGGAVGVLAAGSRRTLAPHARLHLQEPSTGVAGRASEIERTLAERAARRHLFFRRLASATGRSFDEVAADWERGRFLDAGEAVTLGYAEAIDG